ncbi:dimethyladenosine transferase 2, mitochondrial [Pseudonaja textilis]|uniref:dimethyladenosine transferase 2, mitochondrial n=1 Tax=Pseudonaja textilis TaxID=8673 RepID=UPI000EA8749A|nr:dimethyladenosine transferase 2, mitochondrial [Pseudonaja textilis]
MTFVASICPLFGGRQLTLAASTLRSSVRGLKGQSVRLGLHNLEKNDSLKGEIAEMVANAERDSTSDRRFLACPLSARKVASQLTRGRNLEQSKTYLLEFEAGPGVLTRKLLNTGAHVIALESNKSFLPNLESLKKEFENQLEVVHSNFIKLDGNPYALLKGELCSETLFNNLRIFEVPWTSDVPLKVVGIVPTKDERSFIWRYTYFLYECSSIYNYGRIELNLFVSERMYKVFVAKPPDKKFYQALSVLWQTACDIQLLHKVPGSSFLTTSRKKSSRSNSVNELLYLVQLTPRKDLFTDFLTTANSKTFISMVKQCFGKASTKLHNKLNLWTYENARNLLRDLEIPEEVTAGSLYPEAYKSLFERMEQSNQIDRSLFCDIDLLADDNVVL